MTNNTKITFGTSPTFYGEDNIRIAFDQGEIGFELEIGTETYRNRYILTLDNALELKEQIENSLVSYDTFMQSYKNKND